MSKRFAAPAAAAAGHFPASFTLSPVRLLPIKEKAAWNDNKKSIKRTRKKNFHFNSTAFFAFFPFKIKRDQFQKLILKIIERFIPFLLFLRFL